MAEDKEEKLEYIHDANAAIAKEIITFFQDTMIEASVSLLEATQERPLDRVKVLVRMTHLAQVTRCVSNIAEQLANSGVRSLGEPDNAARRSAALVCNAAAQRAATRFKADFAVMYDKSEMIGESGSETNREMN